MLVQPYLCPGAADEGPDRQQVPWQTDDEDEDVEDGEGAHLVVDDARLLHRGSCGAQVGGRRHREGPTLSCTVNDSTVGSVRVFAAMRVEETLVLEEVCLCRAAAVPVVWIWSGFQCFRAAPPETGRAEICRRPKMKQE